MYFLFLLRCIDDEMDPVVSLISFSATVSLLVSLALVIAVVAFVYRRRCAAPYPSSSARRFRHQQQRRGRLPAASSSGGDAVGQANPGGRRFSGGARLVAVAVALQSGAACSSRLTTTAEYTPAGQLIGNGTASTHLISSRDI